MGRVVTLITTALIFAGFAVALFIALIAGSTSHTANADAAQSAGIHASLIWFGTGGAGLVICAILVFRAKVHSTRSGRQASGRIAVVELAQS